MDELKPEHATHPPTIGCLAAIDASLWCVVADAKVGLQWKGGSGGDPDDDFTRAMEFCEVAGATISIGTQHGVVCTVGGCGMSDIWRTPEGIVLWEHYPEDDVDEEDAQTWASMADRAVSLKASASELCGTIDVESGCLLLALPYAPSEYTAADIARAAETTNALHNDEEDQVLISTPNGCYQVWVDVLEHEDELGSFEGRVRIVRGQGDAR